MQSNRAKIQGDTIIDHGNVQNGVTVGNAAKVTVDLFEDFQCPACLAFEQSVGPTIAADIAAGKIQARYHMMAFLDASSNGNNYSTRAANAAICASDINVETFQKYHTILYGKDSNGQNNQPTEGTNGRTDIQLEDYGKQAGITGDNFTTFQQCVSTQEHKAYVQAVTDNASKRNIVQTPTVLINGKELQDTSLNGFNTAVQAAGGGAPATPSPSRPRRHPSRRVSRRATPTSFADAHALTAFSLARSPRGRAGPRPPGRGGGGPALGRSGLGYLLAASFSALPAASLTVLAAGMVIVSPVAGLRPSRASRRPTDSAKKPGTLTFSPLAAASSSVLCRPRRTASTVFCSRSAWSATAATSSLRFTHISLDRWDVPASSMVDRPCFLEFRVPTRRIMSEVPDFRLTPVTLSRLASRCGSPRPCAMRARVRSSRGRRSPARILGLWRSW